MFKVNNPERDKRQGISYTREDIANALNDTIDNVQWWPADKLDGAIQIVAKLGRSFGLVSR